MFRYPQSGAGVVFRLEPRPAVLTLFLFVFSFQLSLLDAVRRTDYESCPKVRRKFSSTINNNNLNTRYNSRAGEGKTRALWLIGPKPNKPRCCFDLSKRRQRRFKIVEGDQRVRSNFSTNHSKPFRIQKFFFTF